MKAVCRDGVRDEGDVESHSHVVESVDSFGGKVEGHDVVHQVGVILPGNRDHWHWATKDQ